MIRPYRRPPPPPPVGIVCPDGRVLTETGRTIQLASAIALWPKIVLYADRADAMGQVIRGAGSVLRFNDVSYRWETGGTKVHLLGQTPADLDDFLAGVVAFRDWLATHQAHPGNARQSSRSLLRGTIERPIYTDGGEAPPIRDVIGGRQQPFRAPGHYSDVELWDIEAAYAETMGTMSYGGRWYRVDSLPDRTSAVPAFCHATVRIPAGGIGPLPRRRIHPNPNPHLRRLDVREYPTGMTLSGIWSLDEILAAERAGGTVKIDSTWIMPGEGAPFAGWWEAIREGRAMPGFAGKLAKMTGNALWGSFAATGARTRLGWETGDRVERPEPIKGRPPQARALAELVCSRVRVRLLSEVVEPYRESLISVHTDGGILDAGAYDLPRGWRLKARADLLIYLGPQAFAYMADDAVTYTVSGVPEDLAPEIFGNLAELVLHYPSLPNPRTVEAWRAIKRHFPEAVPA
jgi:hypothetical protein